MSSSVSNNFGLSSSFKEEAMLTKKQGIVSILGCDGERAAKSAGSLRRTLSADMSSRKWQYQHGFLSPLKKIASSREFTLSSSSEEEEEHKSPIHHDQKDHEKPGQFDIWASILSQKAQEDSKSLPSPPYIHPLVKRSASTLSDKSLEICTERLGSETGSDGFSSYASSESGDAEEEDKEQEEQDTSSKYDMHDFQVDKYNIAGAGKKSSSKSFPPPLPSLSRRDGVSSLHMRPRRDNGRLVLEAVSVPTQSNFRAQRQDGRLVLTFLDSSNQQEAPKKQVIEAKNDVGLFEVEIENSFDVKEEENDEVETEKGEDDKETEMEMEMEEAAYERGVKDGRYMREQAPKLSGGVINVHRLALMMHKPLVLSNRNPTWPNKFNEIVQFEEGLVNPISPLAQSLPSRRLPVGRIIPMPSTAKAGAATAAAATESFNTYEYFWKPKHTGEAISISPITQKSSSVSSNKSILSKNFMANEKQELLVLRGNEGDYFVPLSKGCKEPRRSLLFWEPYCIATS